MSVKFVASIQVSHVVGFWMPHTECEYHEFQANSMTEAMLWLANNHLAYDKNAETAVALRIDGQTLVLWELSRKETATCNGRKPW